MNMNVKTVNTQFPCHTRSLLEKYQGTMAMVPSKVDKKVQLIRIPACDT